MANDIVIGYICAAIAILFFGSNFIVTKKFPSGDGVAFSWLMSTGILLIGWGTLVIVHTITFVPAGLLTGLLWSCGNILVVPIIKLCGLGIGFLLWSGANLLIGYFVGKLGLFGVNKEVTGSSGKEAMNIIGIVLAAISLIIFFFIKPPGQDKEENDPEEVTVKSNYVVDEVGGPTTYVQEEHKLLVNSTEESSIKLPAFFQNTYFKKFLGIALAAISGALYALWSQDQESHGFKVNPLDFIFSHFSGIWITNTCFLIIYCFVTRNKPEIYPNMIVPSIISGMMWGVACCCQLMATKNLGYSVGYALVAIGPMLVNTFWTTVVFKEITGKRNLIILVVSLTIACIGVGLLAGSK
ncbi:10 TM domain-containing transmembrane protein [Acrasis kona]|uniref:10 TM domain-containing transmembrane protein n=1 Tax=Acrasis kona TaxID=1008807 RepID=A0AAW2ZJV7_9EUKA